MRRFIRRANLKYIFAALEEELDENGLTKESRDGLDRFNKAYDLIVSEGTHNKDDLMEIHIEHASSGRWVISSLMFDLISCIAKAPENGIKEGIKDFILKCLDNPSVNEEEFRDVLDFLKNSKIDIDKEKMFTNIFLECKEALEKSSSDVVCYFFEYVWKNCNIWQFMSPYKFIRTTMSKKLLEKVLENESMLGMLPSAIQNPLFPDFTFEQFLEFEKKFPFSVELNQFERLFFFAKKRFWSNGGHLDEKMILYLFSQNKDLYSKTSGPDDVFYQHGFDEDEFKSLFARKDVLQLIFNSPKSNDEIKKNYLHTWNSYSLGTNARAILPALQANIKQLVFYSGKQESLEVMKAAIPVCGLTDEEAEEILKKHPQLSDEIIKRMTHKTSSQDILEKALDCNDLYILLNVSLNKFSSPGILRKLYQKLIQRSPSKLNDMLVKISSNPNTPSDVLNDIIENHYTSKAAMHIITHRNVSQETVQKIMAKKRADLAKMKKIIQDGDSSEFMRAIRKNKYSSLEFIGNYLDRNNDLPLECIKEIFENTKNVKRNGQSWVMSSLFHQKNASDEVRKEIMDLFLDENALSVFLADFLGQRNEAIMAFIKIHPEVKEKILNRFQGSEDYALRSDFPEDLRREIIASLSENERINALYKLLTSEEEGTQANDVQTISLLFSLEDIEKFCSSVYKFASFFEFESLISSLSKLLDAKKVSDKKKYKDLMIKNIESSASSEREKLFYEDKLEKIF